ncbi:protein PFC0760c-like [Nymphalis io]|uniref:protein PFC0760c-like n=1 Tax=Inachis io TaxID=171585 RepID=UPI00216A98CB|nr:protein PFC0760c-like [Nymphalis io]
MDTSKDSYIVKKIDSCPDEGYFFKRDLFLNTIEPSCYLCFCQDNDTAICWPRENKRCDSKYYYHVGRKKRETRPRRSPGFSEIFFRDASRDFFNKRIPEQCKPHESSFSEGCPPADWCIGCTVCDCDANGRWDCHILSFCPDGKGKKQMKKRRGSVRSKITKRQLTTKSQIEPKRTRKTTRKPTRKNAKNINKGKKLQIKPNKVKRINVKQDNQHKGKSNRRTQPKKQTPPCRNRKVIIGNTKLKNKEESKKLILKSSKNNDSNFNNNDSTVKFAETILKKVMASVEKFILESQKNSSKSNQSKMIKKRSMFKNKKVSHKNTVNIDNNKIMSKILNKKLLTNVALKKASEKLENNSRKKREATHVESHKINNEFVLPITVTNSTIKIGYYTYKVESKTTHYYPVTTEKRTTLDQITPTGDETTAHIDQEVTTHINKEIIMQSSNKSINTNKERKISESNIHLNDISKKISETCGKICELKRNIRELVGSFVKSNRTRLQSNNSKGNNFNILTSLKRTFRKIFVKKTNFKNLTIDERIPFRKCKVIRTLCKNIGTCKIKQNDRELQLKLDELRAESLKILKSVRVIKGLLKLLDIKKNNETTVLNQKPFTDNDVYKLNLIIKDEYDAKYGLSSLTETQRTQINYIKENTLVFIQSIERFSFILNDVIHILTNGGKRSELHRHRTFTRHLQISKINNNNTIRDKLKRLKKLFINYNLVQNKFMKRMYDVIVTLEDKVNTTANDKLKEVSVENKKNNYTDMVENYTKNIFKNLRKLKDLVQRLSSKTRKKRAAIDQDDAVEYLLMLMEYLFKQNKPMKVLPVYDGIDILIDVIKNAPDIKPIKKIVLYDDSSQIEQSVAPINYHRDNLVADENNYTLNFLNNKFKAFESTDNENAHFNDYKVFKPLHMSTHSNYKQEEITTINDFDILINKPTIVHVDENDKLDTLNEKIMNKEKDEMKRYDIFVDDTVKDDTPVDTTTNVIQSDTSTATVLKTKSLYTSSPDKITINNNDVNNSDNKIKLDWIEVYDNELERENITQVEETTTMTTTTSEINEKVTRVIKKIHDKYADPVSSTSHEDGDRKFNTDDESYHKQTDILNSLDYGTDKAFIDLDSREDKDNVDSSPLYFI